MKKFIINKIIVIISLCIFIIMLIMNLYIVNVDLQITNAKIKFYYSENKIYTEIRKKDIETLQEIFKGYKLKEWGTPSCGFTQEIAIYINDEEHILCIACDGCNGIFWKNKNEYFVLNKNGSEKLKKMLKKYGVFFPCI